MSTEQWWINVGTGKLRYVEKNQSVRHLVHHRWYLIENGRKLLLVSNQLDAQFIL